jgi:hypothetical protein
MFDNNLCLIGKIITLPLRPRTLFLGQYDYAPAKERKM